MKSRIILILCIPILAMVSCNETQEKSSENLDVQMVSIDWKNLIGNDFYIDPQHSYLGFKIKYFGYSPVRGRFNDFDGTAFYDGINPGSLSVSMMIDAASINTGNERRDNDLTSESTWFDVPSYPIISFKSKEVILKENGGFDMVGWISIKGVEKLDTFQFSKPTALSHDWAMNDQVDFSGTGLINRQDFGVFGGDFWSSIMENGLTQLSDEVEIELDIHCRRADYEARYGDMDSSDSRKIILDLFKQGKTEEAMELVSGKLKNEELSSGAINTIGRTLMTWESYDLAVEIYQLRLEAFPENESSLVNMGICKLQQGETDLASKQFKAAIEIDPTNSWAMEYLRMVERF